MAEVELDLSSEIEEHLYKVLVVGDFGVGGWISLNAPEHSLTLSSYYNYIIQYIMYIFLRLPLCAMLCTVNRFCGFKVIYILE